MSDLFDQFVFDLQRFADTQEDSEKYASIGSYSSSATFKWPEKGQLLYLSDDAEGTTTNAGKATINFSYSVAGSSNIINEIFAVTPDTSSKTMIFSASAITEGGESTTINFLTGGKLYFSKNGSGATEGEDASGFSNFNVINFATKDDKLNLDSGSLQQFIAGENITFDPDGYGGNEAYGLSSRLEGFDISDLKDVVTDDSTNNRYLELKTNRGAFELGGLEAGDSFIFKNGIQVQYYGASGTSAAQTQGATKGGAVGFDLLANLNVSVEAGGIVGVAANSEEVAFNGISSYKNLNGDDGLTINGVNVILQSKGFVYNNKVDKTNSILYFMGVMGVSSASKPADADDIEYKIKEFTYGESVVKVKGLSEDFSGIIVDEETEAVTGFVFSADDEALTVIFEDGEIPEGFALYDGTVSKDTAIALPETIEPSGAVAVSKYTAFENDEPTTYFTLKVQNGTYGDGDTTLTIDGLGENDWVQIVFENDKDGNAQILGVVPADDPLATTAPTTNAAFPEGMTIAVEETEQASYDNPFGLVFADSLDEFADTVNVSTANGQYTYGIGSDSNAYIMLNEGDDTVYALDNADKLVLGSASGTIVDATDLDGDSENDPSYTYESSGNAYFKLDEITTTHTEEDATGKKSEVTVMARGISAFVFADAGDAITIDENVSDTFGLAFLGASGAETPLEKTLTITDAGGESIGFKVAMEAAYDEDAGVANFKVTNFGASNAIVGLSGANFTFAEKTDEFLFDSDGGAIGFNATDTVSMDKGAAELLASQGDSSTFKINGEEVDITAVVEGDALLYDASESSLFGLSNGSKIVNAGNITKIYGASGTIDDDNNFVIGGESYYYTAQGTSAADRAFFNVSGSTATGFTFVQEEDALKVTGDMVEGGFGLSDAEIGEITTPAVYDADGNAKDEYTITKKADPDYAISGFDEGDYAEIEDATITFEKLAGESASIIFDAETSEIGGVSYLTEGDAVRVDGASNEINLDGDVVEIAGESVSYLYTKTGSASSTLTEVWANVEIKQIGTASYIGTASGVNGVGEYVFTQGSQSFGVYFDEDGSETDVDGVKFVLGSNSKVTAIEGVHELEFVDGYENDFADVQTINGQSFAVEGAEYIAVLGNENATAAGAVYLDGGDDVLVTATAGASVVDAVDVKQIAFGSGSAFTIEGQDAELTEDIQETDVEFYLNGMTVAGISDVDAQESVTGDFTNVNTVNGVSFDVANDKEIMVVGNDGASGLTKIASVGGGASILNVGGASEVITNEDGEFYFAGSSTFTVTGDDEVVFQMSSVGAALVEGVDNFGDGGTSATLSGELLGLTINNSSASIVIDGDSDSRFDYMVDENGENATLGGVGNDNGDVVTITETADAQFVKTSASGTFVFASGQSFTTDDDSLTFKLNENGEVTEIYGLGKDKHVTSSFAQSVAVEGEEDLQTVQIDNDPDVKIFYDALEIRDLSNLAIIGAAEGFSIAQTDVIGADETLVVVDAGGLSYAVTGGESFVRYMLDGEGNIVGVDKLAADATLRGPLGNLTEGINGTTFGVSESAAEFGGDGVFAVVGASNGIGAIVELGGEVTVTDAGGATVAKTDDNAFITFADGNEFFVGGSGVKPEVDFALEDSNAVAIAGISSNELVMGSGSAFEGIATVNDKDFAVKGASALAVVGNEDSTGLTGIAVFGGEDVVVSAAAGASFVDAANVDQITFGESSTFQIDGESKAVSFEIDSSLNVGAVSYVGAQESVTGDFTNVADVNGVSFDVQDKDELTIVGSDSGVGITKIADVGGGASILNVGGASEVITNEDGAFYFAGNSTFTVTGDDEVTFQMVEGEDALVEGVDNFGDGGTSATLSGELLGLTINNSSASIVIDGDSDSVFDYMVDENGENATLGGVGNADGDVVTITETADAQFVQTNAAGTFVFASGQSFTTDDDSLTFKLNENGEVTAVYGLDDGKQISGNFSQSVAIYGEDGDNATIRVDGDDSITAYNDAIIITNLSNNATIAVAEDVTSATTDPMLLGTESIAITDADGHSYTVEGGVDEDGVTFLLNGHGHINGVSSLGEGIVLRGSFEGLSSVNGSTFDVKESVADYGGDGEFAIVGASDGISEIVNLGGEVTVSDAGGATVAKTDDNAFITFADGNEFFVGGSGVKPEVEFTMEDSNAVAIAGISSNELVMGSGSAFEGIATVNDQNFAVTGASALAVVGNEESTGLTGIAVFGGEDVVVSAAASATDVLAANVDQITFGESSTFQIDGESKAVSFIIDEQLNVGSVNNVNAQESVSGNFSDIATVNGQSFAVVDDEIMVVGNEDVDGITKIAKVSDGAEIGNVGGASQVITDTEGEFFFGGNSTFSVSGDSSVVFQMVEGEDALVEGVDNFGDGGTSATLSGELLGLTINNSSASIVIDGDSDSVFDYMVDENGENATLGGVGNADGDVVTITETADASFVQTSASGTFTFANSGQSFTTDDDSLTFQLNENGEVTAVYGLDDGKQISGNFSQSVAIYGEDGDNATIRVDGDDSITAYNDAIIITNLSNNATIAVAEDVTSATTDPMLLGTESIAITDADGHSYTVEGGVDEDGVTFLLDGHGHINGVSSLGEGIVLRGSFEGLSSVNGSTFDVKESVADYGGDGEFAVVGASDGISEIVNLGGSVAINDAGGATVAKTDDNAFITFADGNEFFVGGSGVKPEVDFALENSNAVAIAGISSNELVMGSGSAFEGIATVNDQNFDVKGASALAVVGNEGSTGLNGIAVFGGEDVVVSAAAGASFVDAADVDAITFGESSTFQIDGESKAVSFEIDSALNVGSVNNVNAQESVTGDFTNVATVNGVSFAVIDDEVMVVGNENSDGITKIAKVSDGAEIGNVGGASQVITDTEGEFFFGGHNDGFVVEGDSSVVFEMVEGASAAVEGITDFATNGESAIVIGNLNGISINDKGTIDVEGDADEILAYAAEQYEGETVYGLAVGGSAVTINNAASATYIEADSDGKYTFAMDKDADSTTYTVATAGDSAVLFEVEGNQVVGILDMNKNSSVTGDFSNGAYVEGLSAAGEDLQFVQITGDNEVTVVYDEFEVRELSNGASISSATTFKHAYTDAATDALTVTDASGDEFTVENDADGVHYLLDGEGNIVGVDDLDEGATLKGSLGALSSINGKAFGVTETAAEYGGDGEFAVVGGSNGIGAIVELGGEVTVTDAGGATVAKTDDNAFITFADGNEFFVGGSGVKPEVDFALEDSNAVAIAGISSNELVMGSGSAFEGIATVNDQNFDVKGASALVVVGNDANNALTAIAVFGGEDVVVSAAASATDVLAADVDQITFGESSTFQIDGESKAVSFIIDEQLNVGSVNNVNAQESVTGDFTNVATVNGQSFAVVDDEIMVVGNEDVDGLTKIAKVSDDAKIGNVGGASQVITDTEGEFFFGGHNDGFVVEGDSSVVFEMVEGASAAVKGITDFATNGESAAVVIGNLNGISINDKGTIDVEGDADEILAYAAEQYEGETYYGLAVGGSAVTINNAASATFIEADSDGKYTFAMDKDADSTTYTVATAGDSAVLFEVEGNQVVGILDMNKNSSVTGDFSNGAYVEGLSAAGEDLQFVQITGDNEVTVVYDDFEVRELSNGASISSATTFKHAYTDAATDALTVTDASGDEFTVENDADGVHYLLDGEGNIIGVDDLDEGATLKGSLGALSSINGKAFDVTEEVLNTYGGLSAGDGEFAVVGGSNGIGAITELGGRVTVTDGGGASKFATNDNIFITSGGDQYIVAALKELSPEQLEGITPSTVPAELIAQIAPYVIESDGVEFVTNGEDVIMAVNGLSGNELIATFAQSLPGGVGGDFPINGQPVNVKGDVKLIAAQGTDDEDGISALVVGGSSNVVVNKAAGAYGVLALDVDQIAFGSASAFTITSDKDIPGVGFGFSSGVAVDSVALLDNKESVSGYFDDVVQVNGADFDVTDADEIMVVGNASVDAVSKIAKVSDGATIAAVGGASQVITDTNGTFTFTNSNQVFTAYETDGSTTFDMNGNDVANVNLDRGIVFAEDGSQFANVSVNGALVDIKGDEGDMAIGALSSDGIDIVANLGSTSGVTVNNAGGASFIGTDTEGKFTFTADGRTFDVGGDSQVVFVLDADENVTAVMGADKGASVTSDFTKAVAFAGYSNASATEFTTATVQIANDADVMVVHDDFEVRMLSNGASISSATTVYKAYTDAATDALTVTDASGDEFTVYGDADGVMYSLDGSGEIVAVEGLDEDATLGGALGQLKAINGKDFDITETAVDGLGGNGVFSVVGGASASGIGKVIGLGGNVSVNNVGGATELVTDDNILLRANDKRIHISNDADKTVTFGVSGTNDIVSVNDFGGTSSAVAIIDANLDGINGLTINDKGAVSVVGDGNDKVIFKDDGTDATLTGIDNLNDSEGVTIYSSAYATDIKTSGDGSYNFYDKQQFVISGEGVGGNRSSDSLKNAVWFHVDNESVTAISSLNGAVTSDFSNAVTVNGEQIQIADADSLAVVYGSGSVDSAADHVSAIAEIDADATVSAWGSASAISVRGNGDYVFIGADNATQSFTTTDSDAITFVPNDSSIIGGVADFEDGTISFNPSQTASLDVNIAQYPGQTMTFASTQNVTLTIAPYEVVKVEGVTGSVSGLVGKDSPATVIGVDGITSINVNGKDFFVDDLDDQFNVVVHDSTPDFVYDVDGDATVLAESVSVRANSAGSDTNPTKDTFVIGGESYVFDDSKDENDGFTFVTDENGTMNKVASLEGALVINDGEWDGNINGDDFEVIDYPNKVNPPVTVNSGVSGIESVGGLDHKDTVNGDLGAAQVHIPGYGEDGGKYPATTITINGKPYTVVTDPDGVDVTGDNADVITDLDKEASLIGAEGEVTVNGTELEPEEGDVIKGDRDDNTHARIVGDDELIRQATAINHYNHRGYDVDTEETTPAAFNIEDVVGLPTYTGAPFQYLDRDTSDYAQLVAGTSLAVIDFNQPMVISLENVDSLTGEVAYKTEQVFDMSSYSYTKKVYMNGEGTQGVKFNNEGGNLAIVAAGSTGVKNVSLGAGGDAVVMDEDYALQNAVNIYGGIGDDSVFVRHNANTYIDFSAGGEDILVTAGEANARVTIDGYQASTGAAIRVEEYLDVENETAGTIAEGIENGIISFDEGIVRITTDEGRSEINVGTNGSGGQIVNLMTHVTSGDDYKQAVGFTGSDGGIVDGSTYDSPLIMIGNKDNDKTAGSSLLGGTANDTFYGGADDFISTGYGNDYVSLFNDSLRGGAFVQIGDGRTTIDGMNNTLADSSGDVISVSIDPNDSTFSLTYDDELQIVEIESSADGYYALLTDVDTLEGNYTTQYIYDEVGEELYSVAIGTIGSTIKVTEDEDLRPNVFFGYQTAIDFREYTGDAIIDLRGDMAESIIDETIVIIDDDVNTLYAGIGDTALKGDLDDETFFAGKGNTWLYGDGGKNLLVGYEGADKEGQTVFYVLGNEDGAAHTIAGFNYVTDDNFTDTKKVTADALEFDLDDNQITRIDISGNDLVIEITDKAGNDTESALLLDAINEDGTGKDFIVSDNVAQVAEDTLVFDQFADYYYATGKNATVEVSGRIEDDVILWLDEDETGKVFEGDIAVIDATNSDATAQLAGNENDNVIYAGTGETSLWGGEGGNDLLVGNSGGRDTFYYSLGNGDDTITNVKDGDVIALDVSLDQIDEIDMSDATAIRIIMNDGDVLTINDAGHDVGVMIDNGEDGTDTYSTREARSRQ